MKTFFFINYPSLCLPESKTPVPLNNPDHHSHSEIFLNVVPFNEPCAYQDKEKKPAIIKEHLSLQLKY